MTDVLRHSRTTRWLAGIIATIALAAFLLQYALLLDAAPDGFVPATLRFLSYFTILSNGLVACGCGAVALDRTDGWFARPRFLAAVALYIGITGIVYASVLHALWQPQGAQWWADTALHYATPLAYVGWWIACVPHGRLRWIDLPWWLVFPMLYLAWALWRGGWAGEYPYPFLDVDAHGTTQVLRNALLVAAGFVGFGAMLVLVDRLLGHRGSR